MLGPLSYFPTDDIALSPYQKVAASYNLPLLTTANDNASFIALSFDLSPIKSYFKHIHRTCKTYSYEVRFITRDAELALVLPVAATEGQISDSQLHIHVDSIGDFAWDENTADYVSDSNVPIKSEN